MQKSSAGSTDWSAAPNAEDASSLREEDEVATREPG